MAHEFHETARNHGHRIAEHKMNPWSIERPAGISVAGRALEAEEDPIVLGRSVVTGGPPEFERHIAKARPAFHAQGARLTSK